MLVQHWHTTVRSFNTTSYTNAVVIPADSIALYLTFRLKSVPFTDNFLHFRFVGHYFTAPDNTFRILRTWIGHVSRDPLVQWKARLLRTERTFHASSRPRLGGSNLLRGAILWHGRLVRSPQCKLRLSRMERAPRHQPRVNSPKPRATLITCHRYSTPPVDVQLVIPRPLAGWLGKSTSKSRLVLGADTTSQRT